jgi:methylated-DNA-[protein]-cysteine S-methyltransferase
MAILRLPTPVGELTLVASGVALLAVHFPSGSLVPPLHVVERGAGGEAHDVERGNAEDGARAILTRARQQLDEYFARARTTFDLPLAPAGSEFQHQVWNALRAIPFGTTVSYSDIARRLGDVRATRAVGAANGQNPTPIIVPCHRVVGAHGELTGFGGGIDRKRWLLEHEGALLQLGG